MIKLDKKSVVGISALLVHAANIDEIYSDHEKELIKDFIKSYLKGEDELQILKEASFEKIREKSKKLTSYMDFLIENKYKDKIVSITPHENRGCQLSLVIRDEQLNGKKIFNSLTEKNVIGDWREPNVIRMAPTPLYNSYQDVFHFIHRLSDSI